MNLIDLDTLEERCQTRKRASENKNAILNDFRKPLRSLNRGGKSEEERRRKLKMRHRKEGMGHRKHEMGPRKQDMDSESMKYNIIFNAPL